MGFRKVSAKGHRELDARVVALAILGAVVAALALAPNASASSHNPTGEFAPFGECPLSNPEIDHCVYAVYSDGSFDIGSKTIPVANPITFQGGYVETPEIDFYGAENGETLSDTPQPVSGGLLGIVAPSWWPEIVKEWWNEGINNGYIGVNATLELAAPATSVALSPENMTTESGTALGLPVKIKLDNTLLGSNCYVGSNEHPIQLNLTTGNSGGLSGSAGSVTFNPGFTLITLSGNELVNGTFAAPAADGCGGIFTFFVDPLINSIFGLPASSGNNSVALEGEFQIAEDAPVRAP
jgi:hypothetical protein